MKEENKTIIRALNKYGRVPQQYELLNKIDRLETIIDELEKWLKEYKTQCKKYDSNSTIVIINGILDKLNELKRDNK